MISADAVDERYGAVDLMDVQSEDNSKSGGLYR